MDLNEDRDLTGLLLKKEKELQQLSKLRVAQLQEQLNSKDQVIFDLEGQIRRLHEDFNYNLELIQQRDQEIADLEEKVTDLSSFHREKTDGKNSANIYWSQDEQPLLSDIQRELYLREEELKQVKQQLEVFQLCDRDSNADIELQLQEAKSEISKLKYEFESEKCKSNELQEALIDQKRQFEDERNEVLKQFYATKNVLIDLESKVTNPDLETQQKILKLLQEKQDLTSELQKFKLKEKDDLNKIELSKQIRYEQLDEHQEQITRMQNQIKTLLEENSRCNLKVEQANHKLLQREKELSNDVYELRRDINIKLEQLEASENSIRLKHSEIETMQSQLDH